MERKIDVVATIIARGAVMVGVVEVQLLLLWLEERKKCSYYCYHMRRKRRVV